MIVEAMELHPSATRVLISQILRRGEPWLVDQCKEDGYTPLHVAALNGHVQVAELLVGKGKADVDRLNHSNQTPLHLAVHKQHFSIVRLLVRNGRAQVNPKDKDGDTPLHEALRRHTMDQLELLTDVAAVGRLLIGARADADSHLSDNVPPSPETKSDQRQEEQQQPQSTIVGDQPISVNLATFLVSNGADLTVKNKKDQMHLFAIIPVDWRDDDASDDDASDDSSGTESEPADSVQRQLQRSSISNSSPRAVGTLPSSDALNAPNRRLSSTSNNGANNGADVSASMVRHFYTVPNNELESEQIDSECFVCKCRPISRQSLRCFHAYLCEVCCAPKSAPKSCPICAAEQFVSGEAYRKLTDKCRVCDGAVTFVGARAHDERRGMQLVVFRPCGHSLVCRGCGEIVKRCLECRAPVQSISGLLENVAGSETTQARQILNNRRRSVDTPSARSGASVALRGGKRRNSGTELSKMQAELGELRDLARCPVCLDRRKKMVFPCGHACCQFCGDALVDCPICRRKIENKILLY